MVDAVVVEIALEDRWRTLAVDPGGFAAQRFRARRRHHAVHQVGLEVVADARVVELVDETARCIGGRFEADDGAELARVA